MVFRPMLAASLALFAMAPVIGVQAHAVLKAEKSTPRANETVAGDTLSVRLVFNSRIDTARSVITVTPRPPTSGDTIKVTPTGDGPDVMIATLTGLKQGAYMLRWQALSTDGHITRGDIPFTVAPKP